LKIIILGAGQVGATLAENLASEANDITVVDTDRFGCVHYKIGSIFEPFMERVLPRYSQTSRRY
jgi:2-polyprenyl-6-methoxyphenol hydroxylase-like FAD-dependent oxidoreductase